MDGLLQQLNESLINGNFFDVEEEVIATPLHQLLADSKKLPEVLIVLKQQDNEEYLRRVFDKAAIEREHEEIMEERRKQRQLEREQKR